jgi:hypothetical protein
MFLDYNHFNNDNFIIFTIDAYIMTDVIDDSVKKIKNVQQDAEAKAETTKDHAEGKPSSETLNKTKTKIKDALD